MRGLLYRSFTTLDADGLPALRNPGQYWR